MKLLTGRNLVDALIGIIDEAEEELVIVSPFIRQDDLKGNWEKVVEKLKEKIKKGIVEIHTRPEYYGKDGGRIDAEEELSKIFTGICAERIYFNKNLHVKLYFNEKKALITSLNLVKQSIENRIEIGYLTDDIDECKKIREQFYEKYIIEPQKKAQMNIEYMRKRLNEKYDDLKYDNNKITIENKKHSETAFVLYCYYDVLRNNTNYLLQFRITASDENTYSKIEQNFYDILNKHRTILGYGKDEKNKTITFSSIDIQTDEEINPIFRYDDIRTVFCNKLLYDAFFDYIDQIMTALRAILYGK